MSVSGKPRISREVCAYKGRQGGRGGGGGGEGGLRWGTFKETKDKSDWGMCAISVT